jgi:hypothetical protein
LWRRVFDFLSAFIGVPLKRLLRRIHRRLMFLILFRVLKSALMLIALSVPLTAAAQWRLFESDFDDEKKAWQEIEAKLPPYPKAENLIPFEAGAASAHKFFIDAPSISVGEDGVVRYTLFVKAAGGAANVSFEGMRCETRQQKYYAVGHANGSWSKARDPQWRRIEYQEVNRHHGVLYADFFCRGKFPVKSPQDIINTLKYGPRPGTGG